LFLPALRLTFHWRKADVKNEPQTTKLHLHYQIKKQPVKTGRYPKLKTMKKVYRRFPLYKNLINVKKRRQEVTIRINLSSCCFVYFVYKNPFSIFPEFIPRLTNR